MRKNSTGYTLLLLLALGLPLKALTPLQAARDMDGYGTSDGPGGGKFACAWVLSKVLDRAGYDVASNQTSDLDDRMHTIAERVDDPQPGDIIISPSRGGCHGHCGVIAEHGLIYSNCSADHRFELGLTVKGWHKYFGNALGLPVHYWRLTHRTSNGQAQCIRQRVLPRR